MFFFKAYGNIWIERNYYMPNDDGSATSPVDAMPAVNPTIPTTNDGMQMPALPVDPMGQAVPPMPLETPTVPSNVPMPAAPVDAAMTAPTNSMATPPVDESVVVNPVVPEPVGPPTKDSEIIAEVVRRIGESQNVLVALSGDPSVDEMAAAIGLSLYLDKLGKRATAIYSGSTPNALEFLKPEETFEPSVDTLQDFVIALNKEKADHLRYKLDGDFVKIYITPYRTRISEEDLDFSYGDFNVDLVLALDVANGVDLDSALREHGRIMHDAVIVNITTGKPGKLGEIEWSDKTASSVSEMIARLLYSINGKAKIEKEEATAFLTGIVAATNRFSNAKTTPETMRVSSRLMESGANQQLVSKNITPDIENEMFSLTTKKPPVKKIEDPTKLEIDHGREEQTNEAKEVETTVTEKESTLLDDLKAAEASLAQAGAETVSESSDGEPLKIDSKETEPVQAETEIDEPVKTNFEDISSEKKEAEGVKAEEIKPEQIKVEPSFETKVNDSEAEDEDKSGDEKKEAEEGVKNFISDKPEKVLSPSSEMGAGKTLDADETEKYGHMLEDALKELGDSTEPTAQVITSTPDAGENPATASAPTVATNPEINGVPQINYMPMPGDEVLPPPPAPPITAAGPVPTATPEPLGEQPSMQDQVYSPQASDPSAFKIPGM